MKKSLAGVALAVLTVTLLQPTAASAEVICAPITVDGQPLFCQDTAPVDAAYQEATLLLSEAIGTVESTASGLASDALELAVICPRVVPVQGGAAIYVATTASVTQTALTCSGEKITVTVQTAGQPVHVPQICLTTTGTCVGPVDETVPVPATTQPLTVCVQPTSWTEQNATPGQWTETPIAADLLHPAVGCVSVP